MNTKHETQSLIELAVSTPRSHATWLNTLSFLEHIGSRKIIKSQDSALLNEMILEHVSEEARHAYFFKRLANNVSPGTCPNFQEKYLIGGSQTENYFQALDKKIEAVLKEQYENPKARTYFAYLYVTLLVEERAMDVYQVYDEVLKANDLKISLRPVLFEEQRHLDQMRTLLEEKDLHFEKNHDEFMKIEHALYSELIVTLNQSMSDLIQKLATEPNSTAAPSHANA